MTGASSGSRGVYGAIGTSGEWGLKRGCAVAYTDKGTGTGAHDLAGRHGQPDHRRARATPMPPARRPTSPRRSDLPRGGFNAATPDRFALKHAHSEQNPEADWGRDVLRSIGFAFFVLNKADPPGAIADPLTPDNTIVIASSVSNGGGASLRAAEQDRRG